MIPIYEQGNGRGIGHSVESFLRRFDEIVQDHIKSRRAKSFALILRDFNDAALNRILKDQGVFARLDRLSGDKLSVFYLHSKTLRGNRRFNAEILELLQIEQVVSLPAVIFFRLDGEKVIDIRVAELEHANLIHGFAEPYRVIETYVATGPDTVGIIRGIRYLKTSLKFVSVEGFRAILRRLFEGPGLW